MALFDSLKENGETELKASSWLKEYRHANALRQILQSLLDSGCDLSYILIEKRFMVAALIVDNFLDGAYNDNEDYTWCNDNDEKKRAAQYFYEVLTDEEIDAIEPAFTEPSLDKAHNAINLVVLSGNAENFLTN